MTKSDLARFVEDFDRLSLFQQERLILDITELMQKALRASGMRRIDLAKKLGVSRGRISQILSGEGNLTIRTIADVFTAMGRHLSTAIEDLAVERNNWYEVTCSEVVRLQRPWMIAGLDPAESFETLAS